MTEYWHFLQWLARRMLGGHDPISAVLLFFSWPWRQLREFTKRHGHLAGWFVGLLIIPIITFFVCMWFIKSLVLVLWITVIHWLVSCVGVSLNIELERYRREKQRTLDRLR